MNREGYVFGCLRGIAFENNKCAVESGKWKGGGDSVVRLRMFVFDNVLYKQGVYTSEAFTLLTLRTSTTLISYASTKISLTTFL
jgi:hypothetical protein